MAIAIAAPWALRPSARRKRRGTGGIPPLPPGNGRGPRPRPAHAHAQGSSSGGTGAGSGFGVGVGCGQGSGFGVGVGVGVGVGRSVEGGVDPAPRRSSARSCSRRRAASLAASIASDTFFVLRNDAILEEENCILCGLCERYCPDLAIEMIPAAVVAHEAKGESGSS